MIFFVFFWTLLLVFVIIKKTNITGCPFLLIFYKLREKTFFLTFSLFFNSLQGLASVFLWEWSKNIEMFFVILRIIITNYDLFAVFKTSYTTTISRQWWWKKQVTKTCFIVVNKPKRADIKSFFSFSFQTLFVM